MKYGNDIDPIKIVNNSRYLNSISIKHRYDMMEINKLSEKKGFGYPNNNFFKVMSLIRLYENGIINQNHGVNNAGFEDLTIQSLELKEKIKSSGVLEELENMNHTELHNIKQMTRDQSQGYKSELEPMYANLKLSMLKKNKERKVDENVIFPRIDNLEDSEQENEEKSPKIKKIDIKKMKRKVKPVKNELRKISTILKKSSNDMIVNTLTYADASTMLTTDVNNHDKDEYYHMVVDNEIQLVKKYLVHPNHVVNIKPQTPKRIELVKHKGLKYLLDKDYNQQQPIYEKRISKKESEYRPTFKLIDNFSDLRESLTDSAVKKKEPSKETIENKKEKYMKRKLKPLKIYVTDSLNQLQKLNDQYSNNFNLYSDYFQNINYDERFENMEKNE